MPVVWRDALSVGDEMVDSDHKHLINLVNKFEEATTGEINKKAVARVLLELVDYTREHFAREEQLQLDIHFPFHQSHVRHHRDLVRQLTEILTEYGNETDEAKRDSIICHIANFLREWLVNHIVQVDLRMKPYVEEHRSKRITRKTAAPRTVKTPQTVDGR